MYNIGACPPTLYSSRLTLHSRPSCCIVAVLCSVWRVPLLLLLALTLQTLNCHHTRHLLSNTHISTFHDSRNNQEIGKNDLEITVDMPGSWLSFPSLIGLLVTSRSAVIDHGGGGGGMVFAVAEHQEHDNKEYDYDYGDPQFQYEDHVSAQPRTGRPGTFTADQIIIIICTINNNKRPVG